MFATRNRFIGGAGGRRPVGHRLLLGILVVLVGTNRGPSRTTSSVVMLAQAQGMTVSDACGSEADDLANCAAQFGDIDVGACLSCASSAIGDASVALRGLGNSTTSNACNTYNSTLCTSVQDNCQASCDDYRCGAEFSQYYLCEASNAYRNVTTAATEQDGICNIDCGSIGGGNGTTTPSTTPPDNGGSSSCNSTWNELRRCLVKQGRDEQAQGDCNSCIQSSIPIGESSSSSSVDCPALNEQYCTAVASCDAVCAQDACAGLFNVHIRCAAEAAAELASPSSNCQITACGADSATSKAPRMTTTPFGPTQASLTLTAALLAAIL